MSNFEIEELDGQKLSIDFEFHSCSKRYAIWVRKNRDAKFSVQAIKNTEVNDDPVICYVNDHEQEYTFVILYKKDLIKYFENKKT